MKHVEHVHRSARIQTIKFDRMTQNDQKAARQGGSGSSTSPLPLKTHQASSQHLPSGFRTLTSQTGPALIALYSVVGLQLPIASHSILQSINVHCIFTHILLYYYIQIIQFIPYQPFHSFPHLAPSSYVVVEVEEASHRLHGSVWLYKWFKNSFPPRKCV